MLHLSSERLAELADSIPTPAEEGHLDACTACATEREAHRRLLSLAADERIRLATPLTDWDALAASLREEGIIATPFARQARRWARPAMRAAAAIALLVGGVAAGRLSAGAAPLPMASAGESAAGIEALARPAGNSTFASTEEALQALAAAQAAYDRAAAFLSTSDSTYHPDAASEAYRTRLAALDRIAEASREALYELPADPVINQYYLSSMGAREATLRQLGTALPVGTRLTRF